MENKYFTNIISELGGEERSIRWYQRKIQESGVPTQRQLIVDGNTTNNLMTGKLNFFVYDPKHKKTLPYYDRFPLVIPIEEFNWGFLGLNFHYISIPYRMQLIEKLQRFTRGSGENRRMMLEWSRIKNIREIRPVVKKYLYRHVRSRFVELEENEHKLALLLPVQNFRKASIYKVYYDSRRMINS
jgi:hypothetical protein